MGIMFVRYKKFGNREYAYEVKAYWDSQAKKPRQKTRYLGGVVDREKKIFEKKNARKEPEKLVLDFGDVFLLHNFLETAGVVPLIRQVFAGKTDFLLALLSYRLCYGSAMQYAGVWFDGSYAKMQYKHVNLSSQRISEFLKEIGEERLQRSFFREYVTRFSSAKKGVVIDTTSLPSQIHIPPVAWGRSGEEIDKQIRFLLVVDAENSNPLFFRYLPGNIVDVSSLSNTIEEMHKLGIRQTHVYLDAGFFSEENLRELYGKHIQFLTRLPSSRCSYKELIRNETKDLESIPNAVKCGKRILFLKQKKISLFENDAYAHIVLDPERRGREIKKLLLQTMDEKDGNEDLEYEFMNQGIMILVSSYEIKKEDVVQTYYLRQKAEMLFGFSKDDLNLLPVRVHAEQSLRGFLFLQFIALLAFIQLKNRIGQDHTVEEALLTMRNLKCKVYEDEILIGELTKQQKKITEKLNLLVPKKAGV